MNNFPFPFEVIIDDPFPPPEPFPDEYTPEPGEHPYEPYWYLSDSSQISQIMDILGNQLGIEFREVQDNEIIYDIQDNNTRDNNNQMTTLDSERINQIPIIKYKNIKKNKNLENKKFEKDSCQICLELLSENNLLRNLDCNHYFHKKCLDYWLTKKSNTCPLCRKIIE